MAGQDKNGNEPESAFSFAVSELRQAKLAQNPGQDALAATTPMLKVLVNENRGFDPYNSTGSFDRKDSWTRVGRR